MAYERVNAIRNVAINSTGWTDIAGEAILPNCCNTIIILNTSNQAILFCSDPGNPNSQITLQPGQELTVGGAMFPPREGWRFPLNCAACGSVQSTSGPATISILSVL